MTLSIRKILRFRNFIENIFPMSAARQFRRQTKQYRPGTFGIEIEFRASEESENEIDYDAARQAFRNSVDIPENTESWLENNQKPAPPNRQDYHWSKDSFSNYFNIDMESARMPNMLPDSITQIENNLDLNSEKQFVIRKIAGDLLKFAGRLYNLYLGHGDMEKGINFFSTSENFYKWHNTMKATINQFAPLNFENYVRYYNNSPDFKLSNSQVKAIDQFQEDAWNALEDFVKFHEQRARSINRDDYKKKIVTIFRKDIEKWKDEYEEWQNEYNEIKEAWDKWDEDDQFSKWLERNEDRFMYSTKSNNVDEEIKNITNWFRKNNVNIQSTINYTAWNVYEDENGIVEIVSPILQVGSFGFIKNLLQELANRTFDEKTGLHVHIGMSKVTDAFDLVSVAAIIDEDAILAIAGRSNDAIERYSRKKQQLFEALFRNLSDGLLDSRQLINLMDSALTRYYGINFIHAFQSYGTVEIRYLTSQIIHNPELLFKAIHYFLMLPYVAHNRNEIKYVIPELGSIAFTRKQGKIEIKKLPNNTPREIA